MQVCGCDDAVKVFLNPWDLSQLSTQHSNPHLTAQRTATPGETMQERLLFCAIRPSKGNWGLMYANQSARLTMLTLLSLLLISCGVGNIHCSTVPENNTDILSLLHFKRAITNDPRQALSSWNTSIPYCKWAGVSCSVTHPGRVTVLNLGSLGLSGPISPSLGNLTFLKTLNLSENGFSGELPPFNRLHKLRRLWLGKNSLQGVIPDTLTNCSSLEVLDLSNNFLIGEIPHNIGLLSNLLGIGLNANNLTGTIPLSLKNNSLLLAITLADNKLSGSIPDELAQLSEMTNLVLGGNMLSGEIPEALFNMSSLVDLDLSINTLGKELPSYVGDKLPKLQYVSLYHNMFEGHIPPSLGNASNLISIDLSVNSFVGQVPSSLGKLGNLEFLNLEENKLEAKDIQTWEFIDALSNCNYLNELDLGGNQLQGAIPNSIGNLSNNLTVLTLPSNKLSGRIPSSIGNLRGLISLRLSNNSLNGPIDWIGKLKTLQGLALDSNNLAGPIPPSIGNLTQLTLLSLANNRFEGFIPPSLGNFPRLLELNLSYNNLRGNIPKEIFGTASTMIKCILSYNNIEGPIPPEISNLKQLSELQLSSNKLTGEIPSTLGSCEGLSILNLSHNNLSGFIPIELSNLQLLRQLDLSYNNLQGQVPTKGVFGNARVVSLLGNQGLCGGVAELHIPSCPTVSRRRETKYYLIRVLIPIFGLMSILLVVYFLITEKKMAREAYSSLSPFGEKFLKVSYNDLCQATQNFSESNVIGRGSYGSVYRGKLIQGKLEVAVKVLDLDMRGAEKSFLSECQALRNIQHRNLVPIITACSTVDTSGSVFKALIYEFMPNGNLDTWLHQKGEGKAPKQLGLTQRVNIIVDIADALDYLHNGSGRPIVHCDVKPSNILLDDDMNAHLGDFGIASFCRQSNLTPVGESNATSSIGLKGTIGYIAPEYGGGGRASTCGDVYSFGILVLELLTSKRPTDPMFQDGLNIINFVERSFPDQILHAIDAALQQECQPVAQENTIAKSKVYECMLSLVEVALSCTREYPRERMTMREAATRMHAIKESHVSGKDN